MSGRDVPYGKGIHDVLALIRRRWTVAAMTVLATGERQFTELRALINEAEAWADRPLTDRVLTDTLQRAQADGLIERRAETSAGRHGETGQFSKVSYRLTPMGRSLLRSLRPLADWAQQHHDLLTNQE